MHENLVLLPQPGNMAGGHMRLIHYRWLCPKAFFI